MKNGNMNISALITFFFFFFLLKLSRTPFHAVSAGELTQHYNPLMKVFQLKKESSVFCCIFERKGKLCLRTLPFSSVTCESPICD